MKEKDFNELIFIVSFDFLIFNLSLFDKLGQECQVNGTEYVPIGRKKKKQKMSTDDDDQYVDLSDDEIIVEDDDDDLSDLYPGKYYPSKTSSLNSIVFRFSSFTRK